MRKRRDLGQPSDIAFLLIIFFLLLAGITTTQSIALHTTTRENIPTEAVVLHALLTQQGTILLEEQRYTPLQFAKTLLPNTTLHLSVEEETSWQQVVDILSLTEQRQVAGLSLTLADEASFTVLPKGEMNRQEGVTDNQEEKHLKEAVPNRGNTGEMAP